MARKKAVYQAYLLRCWREGQTAPRGSYPWRFSVETILPERRQRGFADLEALVAFLQDELAGAEGEAADELKKEA
jgi:hypothetical protein